MSPDEQRAASYAAAAHGSINQLRKYTGQPYIVHPAAVAGIVRSVPHDDVMLQAAWLHDVVEDTPVSIEMIEVEFGADVADLVGWLTNIPKPHDGSRRARKAIDLDHSSCAPARAQTVKVADLIDNTKSIVTHDPGFAKVYLREKFALLEALPLADPTLLTIARQQTRSSA